MLKRTLFVLLAALLLTGLITVMPAGAQEKPTNAKLCLNCHQPQAGNIRGTFDNVAFKSKALQVKIDDTTEILKFDPDTIKVIEAGAAADADVLRKIKKNHEIRIEYTEQAGVKTATLVASKPPIKVSPDKLITTSEVMKLVAMGPEKGGYVLVDARPAPRFLEGAIATAISIPDPAFDKFKDRLPANKDIQLIFYCGGVT